jgi:hypothetical protein
VLCVSKIRVCILKTEIFHFYFMYSHGLIPIRDWKFAIEYNGNHASYYLLDIWRH